jgi:imidazolonepropionase-like amidohydrolase
VRTRVRLILLVFLLSAPAFSPQYAIHAGTLLDGTGASTRHNLYLTVQDGHISAISATQPRNITIKKFSSDTALPGLLDAHGHISAIGLGEDADERLLNATKREQ